MGYAENSADPLKKEIFYETTYIHPQNGQMMRKKLDDVLSLSFG
jgi:hypothetical protein